MSNFGFFDLRLVNPYHVAFEEARSAVGAGDLLRTARQFDSVSEAVADCTTVTGTTSASGRELHLPLLRLEAAADRIKSDAGLVAILFGSEKFGLSNEDLSYCHWLLRIPSRHEHGSMNLGQAVALVLYELIRESSHAAPAPRHRADQESLERMEMLMTTALQESGYQLSTTTIEKLRRMIRRLELPPRDAEMWQGMLRQILWKLRVGDNRKDQ